MAKCIMHIVQSAGGVSQYLKMLLKYMDKSKYTQVLVCSNEYIPEEDIFKRIADEVVYVDMKREISTKDFKSIIEIRKVIDIYKPQLIYAHSSKAGALARIANKRVPLIYNPHGWAFNMDTSIVKRKIYSYIERALATRCEKIIAISDCEKESAIHNKICSPEKIKVIFNGIDVREYSKLKFSTRREDLNIPKDHIVIGMVGRISKQKSPDIFIKMAAQIKKRVEKSFFIIVGDGEDRDDIEKLVKDYKLEGSVLITGWVKNSYEYINIFDIAVLLSRWEGFGLAIAEYMICGKPIVATNIDAIPSLIINNKTGLLVPVNDYNEAAKSVLSLIKKDLDVIKMVKDAKRKVCEDFDVIRVANQHEKLIDSIII